MFYDCDKCCGVTFFPDDHEEVMYCQACGLGGSRRWTRQLQKRVRAVEFYVPQDERNPAPGLFVCLGPTSEMTTSDISIEHAALLFLANVVKFDHAMKALRRTP